jgi:peroxiredoxin
MRCRSRRTLFWAGLLLALLASTVQAQYQKSPWAPRGAAPSLEWTDVSGKAWTRDQLVGKAVVINFWATWCAPCLEELPSLQTFQEFSQNADVVVLTVNVKDPISRIQQFVSRHGFTFPVISDRQGALAKQWGVRVFPTSVLVSAQGQPVWVIEGPVDWASQAVEPWVKGLH